MNTRQDHLETLTEIRDLMARSSRFRALSSLTGIAAGVISILGLALAWQQIGISPLEAGFEKYLVSEAGTLLKDNVRVLLLIFATVFGGALIAATYMTQQKARQLGVPFWDHATRNVVNTMALPMLSGGIFCLALLYHHMVIFIPSVSLLFYGLALVHTARLTLVHVRYLGWAMLVLGLLAAFFPDYSLLAWAAGFGLAHIIYGISLYYTQKL